MSIRIFLSTLAIVSALASPAFSQVAEDPIIDDEPACTGSGYIDRTRKISDDFVAVRQAPSTRAPMLAKMGYGTQFDVCGTAGAWTLLQLDNGQRGFAFSKLLTVVAVPSRRAHPLPVDRNLNEFEPVVTQDMIDEQEAQARLRQQRQQALAIGFLGALLGAGGGGSSESTSDDSLRRYPDTSNSSGSEEPTYTAPIGGESGLYGSDHSVGSQ